MHKVNGKCNPIDLFTKHLESQRKLDELVALFRCRFLEGRSAIAPALKRDNNGAIQIVNEDDEEGDQVEAHDVHVLPHEYLHNDINKLFPRVVPDEARPGEEDVDAHVGLADPVPAIRARERRNVESKGCGSVYVITVAGSGNKVGASDTWMNRVALQHLC